VGKTDVYDNIVIENQKKKNTDIKVIFFSSLNLHLKDGSGMEFTAC